MDNTTQLFIRACKAENRKERVYRVYRRYYCNTLEPQEEHREIAGILEGICSKYSLLDARSLISALHPDGYWFREIDHYWEGVTNILMSTIALTNPKEQLEGYKTPLRFKRMESAT